MPRIRIGNSKEVTAILTANPNGVVSQQDLPEIARICEEITRRYGGVTHQTLFAASRKPGNEVLRKYYTKDKTKAAIKCWQQESYRILASIHVFIKENRALPTVRYYTRVQTGNEPPMFKTAATVFSDVNLMDQRLQRACEELDLWQRKYTDLLSYSKWFRHTHARITKVVVGVRKKMSKIVDPTDDREE